MIVRRTGKYNALQFYFRRQGQGEFTALTDEHGNIVGGEGQPEEIQHAIQQQQQQGVSTSIYSCASTRDALTRHTIKVK